MIFSIICEYRSKFIGERFRLIKAGCAANESNRCFIKLSENMDLKNILSFALRRFSQKAVQDN